MDDVSTNKFRINHYSGRYEQGDADTVRMKKITCKDTTTHIQSIAPKLYIEPLKELLMKHNFENKYFDFRPGDVRNEINKYVMSKSRARNDFKVTLLRSLNFNRHWKNYYDKPKDCAFAKKRGKVFWRGTTTGQITNPANRFECVSMWWKKSDKIDVSFSFISQNKTEYAKYVTQSTSIDEFLMHKYVMSIEGNDKDSGLNWKLNSNSVVFMAKPRCVSWLMEDQLIPNYHYILVRDDFSDLLERFQWCEANPLECEQIIRNANRYMRMFSDQANEELIEKTVLTNYINNVNPPCYSNKNLEPHLSKNDMMMFYKYLDNAKVYFEFGSGGSTYQACKKSNITQVYSVESDKDWFDKVQERCANSNILKNIYVELCARPNNWGNPGTNCTPNMKKQYSDQIRLVNNNTIDLVLIDGRFRVACCLKCYDMIGSECYIAFDDFLNRQGYHVVLKYFDVVEKTIDNRMVILKKKEGCTIPRDLIEKYEQIQG